MFDSTAFLKDTAAYWTNRYCGDADYIARGLEIALAGKVAPSGVNGFRVASRTTPGAEYLVEVTNGYPRCSCPDFAIRSHRCLHIWASSLMAKLTAEIVRRMTDTPKPRPVQRPRRNDLSNRCETFHALNHQQAEAPRPLAKVIPFRK